MTRHKPSATPSRCLGLERVPGNAYRVVVLTHAGGEVQEVEVLREGLTLAEAQAWHAAYVAEGHLR